MGLLHLECIQPPFINALLNAHGFIVFGVHPADVSGSVVELGSFQCRRRMQLQNLIQIIVFL